MTGRSVHVEGLHHGGQPIPIASVRRGVLVSGRISGQLRDGSPAAAAAQPDQVFVNARRVVEQAGGAMADVVRMTFVLADPALRDAVNVAWTAAFPDPDDRPARHISIGSLPPGIGVACELIAVLPTPTPDRS